MNFNFESSSIKKMNFLLWQLGMFKIKMIGYASPKVIAFNRDRIIIKIKLTRRTRNHLNSMYLGALAVGADLAAGLPTAFIARDQKINISLAFKNMTSKFLKRPTSDVYFVVKNNMQFVEMLEESQSTGERITKQIVVEAYTNYDKFEQEEIANFELGLSVRCKTK